jgi:hypothetical protein
VEYLDLLAILDGFIVNGTDIELVIDADVLGNHLLSIFDVFAAFLPIVNVILKSN